jgi:prepilin-type processing-associated H-X9-DG protein
MAVPLAEGGSQELVRNGFAVGREFYFSYHHFQTLSNELVLAKMLICPTDTRLPAASFSVLQNSNVSYFVGVQAEFSKPESILAGDRNLTANSSPNPSILHGAADNRMWWTRELHQLKGNILFADGHVEEWNNAMLAAGVGGQLAGADLIMPTTPSVTGTPATGVTGYRNYSGANPGVETPPATPLATPVPPPAQVASTLPGVQRRYRQGAASQPGTPGRTDMATAGPTNSVSANAPGGGGVTSQETDSETSTFDQRLVIILRRVIIGFYMLILLILLLWYLFNRWQRSQRRKVQIENEL